MRTRTLLLLSVACGLAILLAGGLQLVRISGTEPSGVLVIGDRGQAGDAVVVVTGFDERADRAVVTVVLSGVDDPTGLDGFALRAPNTVVDPGPGSSCAGFTVEAVTCTLSFPAGSLAATDRQLVFERGEGRVVWNLV
ncbi:MAG: hypothetical protein ACO3C1_04725 [Ilumatobacteraceae bacterium]